MTRPLISCICITRFRPQLLQRALHCFDAQTYPNRELIIVLETGDLPSETIAGSWNQKHDKPLTLVYVAPDPNHKLGLLRNLGISHAAGQYFCQWDDDDWYHPERLARQYEYLAAAGSTCLATVLDQWIIYNAVNRQAYLSCIRNWEGSLLCDRNFALNCQYQNLARGEDSPLVETLAQSGKLQVFARHAYLYIYIFHGTNTWDFGHFSSFIQHSRPLAATTNKAIEILLTSNDPVPVSFLEKI